MLGHLGPLASFSPKVEKVGEHMMWRRGTATPTHICIVSGPEIGELM